MPKIWVPALMRDLAGGRSTVEVEGRTVREVLDNLEAAHPGMKARLTENGELRPEITIAINGEPIQLGMLQAVPDDAELQIVPALSGG